MKVVVLKPQKNLGKIGDVIEVKDGYGRNYLIPRNIAVRATEANLKMFEEKKHELEEKNMQHLGEAKSVASKLEGKDFAFIRQSSDDGRLFGSVSTKEIAHVISKVSPLVHHSHVILEHPIKSLGVFEVTLHIHVDVDVKVLINIARSETEAQEAIKSYKAQHTASSEENAA